MKYRVLRRCVTGRTWTYSPPPGRRNCMCKDPRKEGMGSHLNAGDCGQSTEGTWWEAQPEERGWGSKGFKDESDVVRLTFLLLRLLFIWSVYSVALQPPSSTLPSLFSWHWFVGEGRSSSATSRIWLIASAWCHWHVQLVPRIFCQWEMQSRGLFQFSYLVRSSYSARTPHS